MTTLSMTHDDSSPLTLEAGHRIFITTGSNVAQCRELVWAGPGAALTFRPEEDWPDDSFLVSRTDPRGGHPVDQSEKAAFIEANRARGAKQMAAQLNAKQRALSATLSLRAFGQGREAPFRGFP